MLIVYLSNGDFSRSISKEAMVERVIKEMKYEGNQVTSHENKGGCQKYIFSDGSVLQVRPTYQVDRKQKYTHIYLDDIVKVSKLYTYELSNLLDKENEFLGVFMTYKIENDKLKVDKF